MEWHLNSATGAVIGNSIGGNGICHTFPNGGTYTVVMVVTRKKPDGSICEVFVHSKAVTVTCLVLEECTDSDFPNLAFAEGAIGGGMLSGGASAGWQAVSGEPLVIEGAQGSLDAWTILVSGNFDTSAVVGTIDSAFVEKSLVILKMRIRPIGPTGQFRSMACDYVKPKPVNNNNNNDACYRNLHLPLLVLNSSEWADVEMPLDLSALIEIASCDTSGNGVWIQPSLTVTNPFGNNQGGEETYSYLQIDNLCIDGIPVSATGNTKLGHRIRLYPNPTSGGLTLEFKGAVPRAGSIQILDFLGRILRTETLPPGSQAHQISIATLPAGVYFVKVLDGGEQVWAQKVVKQ